VYGTSNTWVESDVTWNNRPPASTTAVADFGAVRRNAWVEVDVTKAVNGNGTYSFVLATSSTDGSDYRSRESGTAPRLVVTTTTDTADGQAPSVPASLTASNATANSVSLSWPASSDNVGVTGYSVYVNGNRIGNTAGTSYTAGSLSCGTSYTTAVDAYDAAGNRSAQKTTTATTTACPPPTPPPGACARFASVSGSDGNVGSLVSPFRSPQRLADSLAAGETGCLRGGVYDNGATYVVRFGRGGSAGAPITIRSYPGERARLVGIVYVPRGSNHVTLAAVDVEGRGSQNTVQVNAEDFTLEDSDLTNAWRGNSCLMLGDPGYGRAVRTIVRRNRFHECGNLSHGNKDHAIYAGYVSDAQIVDNLFWNSAAYAIQLYPDAQRTRFAHNVIDGDSPSVRGGLIFGGEGSYASSNNTVEQNIITYATINIEYWWGGTIGSGNIARNNCLWAGRSGNISSQVGFTASNNLTADPLFTNKATRDYRLKAGSPCLPLIGHDTAALLQ
jgi:Right handed beta helix region